MPPQYLQIHLFNWQLIFINLTIISTNIETAVLSESSTKNHFWQVSYFRLWWGVVKLILAGGCYKLPRQKTFGFWLCFPASWYLEPRRRVHRLAILAPRFEVPGDKIEFGAFRDPPAKISYSTPNYYQEYEICSKLFMWRIRLNLSIQDLEAAATQDGIDEEGEGGRRGQEKNQQASSCSPEGQEIFKILLKTISIIRLL